ncbi:MAG: helix-turn-helix domain-containing protein [Clostridia bacterium]|nr:helix-turn-helix domain-containing protein [Clostridia bacterium]
MNSELLNKLLTITEEEQNLIKLENKINRNFYMDSELNVVNSKKLLDKNKLITVRPHTRFVHFPEHTHDYIEVVYMCSGQTTHIINGKKVVLKKGDLLFLSQNAKQEIYPAKQNDIAINFIILPQFFDSTLTMISDEDTPLKSFIVDCLKNKNSNTAFLLFEVADILPIQNLIENLIWTLLNTTQNKRKINQTTMELLFLQLLNYTDTLSYSNEKDHLSIETLRYIEENYRNGSLTELASYLHYDFAWFSREIKNRLGKTYTELVQEKRLSQACYLLKNTNINIDEISRQIGYDNISYFHRLFKNNYGITPLSYRKSF